MKLKLLYLFALSIISWSFIQNNTFTFQKGNQKVTLLIENGEKFLKYDEKAKLTIITENIDARKFRVIAPGLRLTKGSRLDENKSIWEITPKRIYVKNDTLKLHFSTRDIKDEFWSHEFKILVE